MGGHTSLPRSTGYNGRGAALQLLPIQRDEAIAQLLCRHDIDRVIATDVMVRGNACRALRARPIGTSSMARDRANCCTTRRASARSPTPRLSAAATSATRMTGARIGSSDAMARWQHARRDGPVGETRSACRPG